MVPELLCRYCGGRIRRDYSAVYPKPTNAGWETQFLPGLKPGTPCYISLKIRVTGRAGESVGFTTAAIESFGKAFLLLPDCLIGWLAMPGSKQRLFNRISGTVVIETREREEPEGVTYVKSKE